MLSSTSNTAITATPVPAYSEEEVKLEEESKEPAICQSNIDEYRLVKEIGEGHTSKVYLGMKQDARFAIKVLKFENESERTRQMVNLVGELRPL